ncbi:MAG: 3D domain-containing protein [Lentisphaeria bacterium]|nr:3D domain-containing protein [Lentisphaeria bacterium]
MIRSLLILFICSKTIAVEVEEINLILTGYCACEICSGWEKNDKGEPVFKYGRNKGKVKIIGQTSSGAMARQGTLAANLKSFAVGTEFIIPGYGYGIVQDTGSAIKKNQLDLFFTDHKQAINWGRRLVRVKVIKK